MRARAYGLALAIDRLELTEGPTRDGIIRLAQGLADGLQRLQTLFDVERRLWRAAEKWRRSNDPARGGRTLGDSKPRAASDAAPPSTAR